VERKIAELSLQQIGLDFDTILESGTFYPLLKKSIANQQISSTTLLKWAKAYTNQKSGDGSQDSLVTQWVWYTHMLYPKFYEEEKRRADGQQRQATGRFDFSTESPASFKIALLPYLEDVDIVELCMVNNYFNACFGDQFWYLKFFDLDNTDDPDKFCPPQENGLFWKYLYFQKKDRLKLQGRHFPNNNILWETDYPYLCNIQ